MKAKLKRLHSPDIVDLRAYTPDSAEFGFLLQLMVGPADGEGEESFDLIICTPDWLKKRLEQTRFMLGRGHLIVGDYNYSQLESFLRRHVERTEGMTWPEIAGKLAQFSDWEFDDYRE